MNDDILLETLREAAEKLGDQVIIQKLKDVQFLESFEDIKQVVRALGYSLCNKNHELINSEREIYLEIAKSLVQTYFTTYFVNVDTGYYIGYSTSEGYNNLKIEERGNDFFADVSKNIANVIYPEDRDMMIDAVSKKNIYKATSNHKIFQISYRLMIDNKPTYVTLTAMRLADDTSMIIGVSNIDEMKRREIEYETSIKENATYSNIALALAKYYFVIYYINTKNEKYHVFTIDPEMQQLHKQGEGANFFEDSIKNAGKVIVKEDRERFLSYINKDALIKETADGKALNLEYQQLFNGVPRHVALRAVNLISDDDHIVIAVSDIDDQKKKEQEYQEKLEKEKLLARTDALTGCLNRNSYLELEKKINEFIAKKQIDEFSAVIFDINDLKLINDSQGHEAGDHYIIAAVNMINKIFKNSTLYRVGGDEFVIILEGSDFYKRDHLVKELTKQNEKNSKDNKVVVACGYSDFDSENDKDVSTVFNRADKNMYINKSALKKLKK